MTRPFVSGYQDGNDITCRVLLNALLEQVPLTDYGECSYCREDIEAGKEHDRDCAWYCAKIRYG